MKGKIIEQCNFDEPGSVVAGFISAMYHWELDSWKAMRAAQNSDDPPSYQEVVKQRQTEIFNNFCTNKGRKQGRLGSFQNPPEYNPSSEKVSSSTIEPNGRKAIVETVRESRLGGGIYRYVLYRREQRWLIDNLTHEVDGVWEKAIL